jgi:2,3-bisphosphoglycerate-independent phosphoglycerate mutase
VVEALLILDGASEPLGAEPTSLERARTPALDRLGQEGSLSRLRTVAPWLPAGSEAAIPALLGWVPPAPVDRGALEAAARGIEPAPGERAWRVDVRAGAQGRAGEEDTAAAAQRLARAAPGYRVHRLGGHRLLLVGPSPLRLPRLDLEGASELRVWPEGIVPAPVLGEEVVVVAAAGAAAGAGRLLGAAVVVPPGATGRPGTDLTAKAAAAVAAIESGARRVVVHVGAPDEAAHARDAAAKVAAIEATDARVVAPLATAVGEAGGTLEVCPDHGCDPATGEHDAAPVPRLLWPAPEGPRGRLTERAVAALPVLEPDVEVAA